MKAKIIEAFKSEFNSILEKIEIIDLLDNNSPMDSETIEYLKLPSNENNIVWHPGVYFFIGNNELYRVGVSLTNSRARVMQHLEAFTGNGINTIWDINNFEDKSILLLNVKEKKDKFWLLAIEAYFEMNYNPLIKAKRIG